MELPVEFRVDVNGAALQKLLLTRSGELEGGEQKYQAALLRLIAGGLDTQAVYNLTRADVEWLWKL